MIRKVLFVLLGPITLLVATKNAEAGLEEKRLIEQAKTTHIPSYEKKMAETCGFNVKVDVDWNTFETDKKALEGLASGLHTGWVALKEICKDDIGKDAAKAKIKSFRLVNAKTKAEMSLRFDDGVITAALAEGGAASVGHSLTLARTISAGL
jgi:hypothetical protein